MKKSLVALAVLASTSAAFAQSSVTLFGIVDAGYARVTGTAANGASVTRSGITNSGLNSSRIGFRGTEDLGGGMKAGFWLEGQLSNDDGNAAGLNFQRRSYVSLTGGFGEIRIGREYTPTFWNTTVYDPFGTNGIGQANSPSMLAATGGVGAPVRNNNSINYLIAANGFDFHGQIAFGENASNAAASKTGDYTGFRLGYTAGPISAHIASSKTKGAAANLDTTATNFGAAYNLGFVRPMIGFGTEKATNQSAKYTELGATAPMGSGQLRVAYSRYDRDGFLPVAGGASVAANDWNKFAIGYGLDLSKRTQVYGTYAKVSNKGASAVSVSNNGLGGVNALGGAGSTGIEFGVRHTF